MLKKKEYQEFTRRINQAMAWHSYSAEMIFFYIASFVIPPFAGLIMVKSRPLFAYYEFILFSFSSFW